MYIDQRFETANQVVEQLQQLLENAGLHELGTRLQGINVDGPASAALVRDVLRRGPAPTEPKLQEWFLITLENVERTLKPDEQLLAA